jgi:hypothetical protein
MQKCLPNIEVQFSGNHMNSGEKNRNNHFFKVMSMNVFIKSRGSEKLYKIEYITCTHGHKIEYM